MFEYDKFLETNDIEGFTKYIEDFDFNRLSGLQLVLSDKWESILYQDDMINTMDVQPLNGGNGTLNRKYEHKDKMDIISVFLDIVEKKIEAKYPPRIYYISYGLFCSILLILLCNKYKLRVFKSKIITYISNHSMWIYLWHILTLDVYKYLKLPEIWFIKLIFVYILALSIVIFVNQIIKMIETKHKYSFLKYFK